MTDDIFDDIDIVRWPLVLDVALAWQETGECQEGYVLAFVDKPDDGKCKWEARSLCGLIASGTCSDVKSAMQAAESHARSGL